MISATVERFHLYILHFRVAVALSENIGRGGPAQVACWSAIGKSSRGFQQTPLGNVLHKNAYVFTRTVVAHTRLLMQMPCGIKHVRTRTAEETKHIRVRMRS